jgi:hypothetical protein
MTLAELETAVGRPADRFYPPSPHEPDGVGIWEGKNWTIYQSFDKNGRVKRGGWDGGMIEKPTLLKRLKQKLEQLKWPWAIW